MTDRGLSSKLKLALILVASGLLVAGLVAVMSTLLGAPLCTLGPPGDPCRELVASLSWRAGIVAGIAAVLMILFVVGLARMVRQDDRDRAERAMEIYRASRGTGRLAEE